MVHALPALWALVELKHALSHELASATLHQGMHVPTASISIPPGVRWCSLAAFVTAWAMTTFCVSRVSPASLLLLHV